MQESFREHESSRKLKRVKVRERKRGQERKKSWMGKALGFLESCF